MKPKYFTNKEWHKLIAQKQSNIDDESMSDVQ